LTIYEAFVFRVRVHHTCDTAIETLRYISSVSQYFSVTVTTVSAVPNVTSVSHVE